MDDIVFCVCIQLMMQMVLNRGDTFLVEEYAYSHLLEGIAEPKGYVPLPVPIDQHGIVPSGLRRVSQITQNSTVIWPVSTLYTDAPARGRCGARELCAAAGAYRPAWHGVVRPATGESDIQKFDEVPDG